MYGGGVVGGVVGGDDGPGVKGGGHGAPGMRGGREGRGTRGTRGGGSGEGGGEVGRGAHHGRGARGARGGVWGGGNGVGSGGGRPGPGERRCGSFCSTRRAGVGESQSRRRTWPGQESSSHLEPRHPSSQTQAPPSHVPWPEQPPGQVAVRHASPVQPLAHRQCASPDGSRRQRPCPQLPGHCAVSHRWPSHPSEHTQSPSSQRPCAVHVGSHTATEQSAPRWNGWQTQVPASQVPRPEH